MEIIERIKTNKLFSNPTEIQKLCLKKLQSNPLPNLKSELWRLSNKSKFSNFLDYSVNEKDLKFDTPYQKNHLTEIGFKKLAEWVEYKIQIYSEKDAPEKVKKFAKIIQTIKILT